MSKDVANWIHASRRSAIKIDRWYFFPERTIFNLNNGQLKKMDTSNRNKALDDALATMLGIDDKYFAAGTEEKISCPDISDPGMCVVRLSPWTVDTAEHFEKELFGGDLDFQKSGNYVVERRISQGVDIARGWVRIILKEIDCRRKAVRFVIQAPKDIEIRRF